MDPPGKTIEGSWVRRPPGHCQTKRKTTCYFAAPSEDVVITHADCVCNEVLALKGRHQALGPKFDERVLGAMKKALKELKARKVGRASEGTILARFSGGKKEQYIRAFESLKWNAVTRQDAYLTMFLKDDKYTKLSVPRAIQYRSKRYTGRLLQYLHPIEEVVWASKPRGYRCFAKGRNSEERAQDLLHLVESIPGAVVISGDHTKWDSRVNLGYLKLERRFYHRYNTSLELQRLLRMQEKNKGFTKNGLRYFTPGTRCSGDANTGLGNSILNYALLRVAYPNGYPYVDGDDWVVVHKGEPPEVDWAAFGQETKVSYELEFCQSKIVHTQEGPRMVRAPERLLSRVGWTTKNSDIPMLERVAKSVGMCEVALNRGVPIGQALGMRLTELGAGKFCLVDRYFTAKLERAWEPIPVLEATRESYFLAFGVTPQEQVALERKIAETGLWGASDLLGRAYGM